MTSIHVLQAIMEFLEYLEKWTSLPLKEKIPILTSTLTGLRVSLRATLEIVDMLHREENWIYLLTCRLTQDVLEVQCLKGIIE